MSDKPFGLKESPFGAGHDRRFTYPARSRTEVIALLRKSVADGKSVVLLTGDPGVGKTSVVWEAFGGPEPALRVAILAHATLMPGELLEAIGVQFGLPRPESASKDEAMAALERCLRGLRAEGHAAVLVMDDAHGLSPELFEELQRLASLEAEERPLLQTILVGLPDLDRRLGRPEFEPLRKQVALHLRVHPLSADETVRYLHHRIAAAGAEEVAWFPAETCREIHEYTYGFPRDINSMAARALERARRMGAHAVLPEHVRASALEARLKGGLAGAPAATTGPEAQPVAPPPAPGTDAARPGTRPATGADAGHAGGPPAPGTDAARPAPGAEAAHPGSRPEPGPGADRDAPGTKAARPAPGTRAHRAPGTEATRGTGTTAARPAPGTRAHRAPGTEAARGTGTTAARPAGPRTEVADPLADPDHPGLVPLGVGSAGAGAGSLPSDAGSPGTERSREFRLPAWSGRVFQWSLAAAAVALLVIVNIYMSIWTPPSYPPASRPVRAIQGATGAAPAVPAAEPAAPSPARGSGGHASPDRGARAADPRQPEARADEPETPRRLYGVEVASYLDLDRATREGERLLTESGLPCSVVDDREADAYRVILGSFGSRRAAERAADDLLSRGLAGQARVVTLPGENGSR